LAQVKSLCKRFVRRQSPQGVDISIRTQSLPESPDFYRKANNY